MGLSSLAGSLPPFFGTMGYPAPNPYGNDPRRGGGMNDLRRKYKPYGDGGRNNPYQPGFPAFPPRDFGLAGNPYGGGPKAMAPVGTPLPSGYTGPMPMQSDTMMGLGAAGQMGLLGQLAQQPVPPELVDVRNTGALLQQVGMPSQYSQSPYSNFLAQQGSMTQEDRMAALQQLLGNAQPMAGAYPDYASMPNGMVGYATQNGMGNNNPMADATRQPGMGGANPYTINQPATLMPQPMQEPMQQPMPQQRDPRQPQMQQQQMQGNQMMNRPFAVRGR